MSQLEHRLAQAESAMAAVLAEPGLHLSERAAMRGALGTVRGVRRLRLERTLTLVPGGREYGDARERQLPVGDRDGGCPDAA